MDEKVLNRFWSKIDKSAGPDGCWNWIASVGSHGYGVFGISHTELITSHRMAWTLANGKIPDGGYICHKCDNRKCCNPAHLFLGTQGDNMRDMIEKGRQAMGSNRNAPKGEMCKSSKLKEYQVISIRKEYRSGLVTQVYLSNKYKVSSTAIKYIVENRNWSWLGDENV